MVKIVRYIFCLLLRSHENRWRQIQFSSHLFWTRALTKLWRSLNWSTQPGTKWSITCEHHSMNSIQTAGWKHFTLWPKVTMASQNWSWLDIDCFATALKKLTSAVRTSSSKRPNSNDPTMAFLKRKVKKTVTKKSNKRYLMLIQTFLVASAECFFVAIK